MEHRPSEERMAGPGCDPTLRKLATTGMAIIINGVDRPSTLPVSLRQVGTNLRGIIAPPVTFTPSIDNFNELAAAVRPPCALLANPATNHRGIFNLQQL